MATIKAEITFRTEFEESELLPELAELYRLNEDGLTLEAALEEACAWTTEVLLIEARRVTHFGADVVKGYPLVKACAEVDGRLVAVHRGNHPSIQEKYPDLQEASA